MNLTVPDLALITGIFSVLQFIASLWVKSHLEESIKLEYDKTLDVLRKQRDIRVSYLIEAYRVLARRANLPKGVHPELAKPIESALSDIQLLGTQEQIEAAKRFAMAEADKKLIPMDELLNTFRAELRRELALPPVEGSIWSLRYENRKETGTSQEEK